MEHTVVVPRALKQKITCTLTRGQVVLFSARCGFEKIPVTE